MVGSYLLLATTLCSALLMGFVPALLGRMRLPLSQRLGVPEAAIDRLGAGFLLVLIPLLLAGGCAVDRWGAREILFTGALLSALGIAALGLAVNFRALLLVILVLAAASACLTTAGTTLMPKAFLGDEQTAASLNLGFIGVSLGYLLLPVLADFLRTRSSFRQSMLTLALFCLVPATLTVVTPKNDFGDIPEARDPSNFLADPRLWLAGLIIFLYLPLEGSLAGWATRFLVNLGYTERQIPWWLAGYWTMFLGARLATGWLLPHLVPGFQTWLILLLILISAISLGNLSGAYGLVHGQGLVLMGAWYGPLLPTFLGVMISKEFFAWAQGTALGALFAVGALANLLLQPALAAFAQSHSVRTSLLIPIGLALIMAVPALILALAR